MMKHKKIANNSTKGFTIVELMIATAVFSVLLLVITFGIVQVSRVYYKGITESNTQDVARRVSDIVTQSIQFSGGDISVTDPGAVPGSSYQFCLGNEQFSYTLGYQVSDSPDSALFQTHHALVQRTLAGCTAGSTPQNVRNESVVGKELLEPRMRLAKLGVSQVGAGLYKVDVRVVFGDDDLLFSPSDPSSPQGATRSDAVCRSATAGTQFCAVSELSTIVRKRVQ